MRRYGKTDANQGQLVEFLRTIGAQVQSLASVGGGVPDLLVAFRGRWYVIEIKDGSKPPSRQKLTEEEQEWHDRFSEFADVHVAKDEQDIARILGIEIA